MNPINLLSRIGDSIQNAAANASASIARAWGHLFRFITRSEREPVHTRTTEVFREEVPKPLSTTSTTLQGKTTDPSKAKPLPKTPPELKSDIALLETKLKAAEENKTNFKNALTNKNREKFVDLFAISEGLTKVNEEIDQLNKELQPLRSKLTSFGIKKKIQEADLSKDIISPSVSDEIDRLLQEEIESEPIHVVHIVSSELIQPNPKEIADLSEDIVSRKSVTDEIARLEEEIEAEMNAFNPIPVDVPIVPSESLQANTKEIADFNSLKTKLQSITSHHKLKLRDGELEVVERKLLNVKNQNSIKHANILNPDAGEKGIETLNTVLDQLTSFTKNEVIKASDLHDLILTLENQEWTEAPLKDESTRNKLAAIKTHLENKIIYEKAFADQEKLFNGYVETGGAFSLKKVEELEEKMFDAKDNLDRSAYFLNKLKPHTKLDS